MVSIDYKFQDITVYTDEGTPIHAQMVVEAYVTYLDDEGKPIPGKTDTRKTENMFAGLKSNCFGYALAKGDIWITDDGAIDQLLKDEFNELKEGETGSVSVIWWYNSKKGREAAHAAFNNSDGSYNQKDKTNPPNKNAISTEFWGDRNNPNQNPKVSQYNKKKEDSSQPPVSVNGVILVSQAEIDAILNLLGLKKKN